jgi:prevent-host-death family protein
LTEGADRSKSWPTADTVPFSDAKAHLSELADRVENEHDRILVTRNGRPSFVLMSVNDLESLEETLDIARDPDLMESISRSPDEAGRGERVRLRDHLTP